MAAVMTPQKPTSPMRYTEGDDYVVDTRTPSPVLRSDGDNKSIDPSATDSRVTKVESGAYEPDLSSEVAMLSTKLINAINYQTNLDDSLQAARHDLDQAQVELKRVRAEKQSLDDAISQGVLVRKAEFERTIAQLRTDLAEETERRASAEKLKKQTEGELENLTSALFEEANTMVAAARKDTEAAEKRNSQLKSQLQDTEFLIASQQEQLQDLKQTMEKLDLPASEPRDSSVPSTPRLGSTAVNWDTVQDSPTGVDVSPEHPLYFSQLVQPVLRTDVCAYNDFAELLSVAKKAAPHSRTASGNVASSSQPHLGSTATTNSSTSPSLPGAFSFSTSANTSPSSSTFGPTPPSLKDSKFYKRALLEDIEPTLRLDVAPGLTFLSRRTVFSSLINGTLAVEPFVPTNYKFYAPIFACSLCGESRKQDPYVRKHRFRTSESEDAQRYPLCDYCLGRIRATGDFLGFLRLVKDGHWRCESEQDEKGAWEEAVRLRERMFWARVGGGVVPAGFRRDMSEASREGDSKGSSGAEVEEGSLDVSHETVEESQADIREAGDNSPAGTTVKISNAEDKTIVAATDDDGEDKVGEGADKRLESDVRASLEEVPSIRQALITMSSAAAATIIPESHRRSPEQEPAAEGKADDTTTTDEFDDSKVVSDESHEQSKEHIPGTAAEHVEEPALERESTANTTTDDAAQAIAGASGSRPSTPRPLEIQTSIPSPERRPGSASSSQSQIASRRSKDFSAAPLQTQSSSLSTASAATEGRRPSSVLDRVRAMEAKTSNGAADKA